jgi:hypothetical protein
MFSLGRRHPVREYHMQGLKTVAAAGAFLIAISTSPLYGQNETPTTRPDCPPDGVAKPREGETTGSPPLGDRLSRSKGVICAPKGVDPGMVNKPPPGNAPMPVIPPPGTPGGDPDVQPK